MPRARVYIAYTGGTIGMSATRTGFAPQPGYLHSLLAHIPELTHAEMPDFDLHEYEPLLDSANIQPKDWVRIAGDLSDHYREYDGFVVLHGTDTMAYTASALSFLLEGLAKPVILTGSQLPLGELRSDGRDNLITALYISGKYTIPEVCVYFGSRLMRGCRTVKVDATGFDAFDSPNYPPLGSAGVEIQIHRHLINAPPEIRRDLSVPTLEAPSIGALRLFPGISATVVDNILRPPLKGLVLEAFGVGNAPDLDSAFLNALQRATQRGIVIVACSQCLRGFVDLADYSTGSALAAAGVISGYDLTSEAALTKLFYLFSQGYQSDQVRKLMQANLRGELTPPNNLISTRRA